MDDVIEIESIGKRSTSAKRFNKITRKTFRKFITITEGIVNKKNMMEVKRIQIMMYSIFSSFSKSSLPPSYFPQTHRNFHHLLSFSSFSSPFYLSLSAVIPDSLLKMYEKICHVGAKFHFGRISSHAHSFPQDI